MAASPELINDAVVEILLRLPPDEPAHLVRASLVCKPWRRILSDPTFVHRYRRFHRSPHLLAFVAGSYFLDPTSRFIPTTKDPPFGCEAVPYDCHSYFPLDCRHGRLLLKKLETDHFLVWDPFTGSRDAVPEPPIIWFAAAVLCATARCDHFNCHGGPYRVLCMGTDNMLPIMHTCVYSSQAGTWGTLVSVHIGASYVTPARGTLPIHVYGKTCHLPVELEHKAYWAIKEMNLDVDATRVKRRIQISELEEARLKAYHSASIYKERMKRWYNKRLKRKEFKEGDKVLLFNSRFKLFDKGKLQSKWDGPYIVHSVSPTRAVKIMDIKGDQYVVNGQQLKVYLEPDTVPLHYMDIYSFEDDAECQA